MALQLKRPIWWFDDLLQTRLSPRAPIRPDAIRYHKRLSSRAVAWAFMCENARR
jgi:hypothetical protein